MSDAMNVFDRSLVRRHRDRAAERIGDFSFLFDAVAQSMADRLLDIARTFPTCLDLGSRGNELADILAEKADTGLLVRSDFSPAMAEAAQRGRSPRTVVAADEEHLPFAAASFELVTSNLNLHWTNDLPGALIQIRQVLKPDGLFLGTMLGGETLHELRNAWLQAEIEQEGGASPRLSPLADLRDAGALLQRTGFALPVADADRITVSYPNALKLMQDLRGMGETNAIHDRRRTLTRRATLFRAAEIYQEEYGDSEGRIAATFDVLTLTGWAPDASQQQPLRPGSARSRLADALGVPERGTDDSTGLPISSRDKPD
ncbi:methyltransferase domain-containing protein [Denitrobaculum tricleocarpae]|uniref:Methyltransferase domain-containing protein n=1 Tax=Denitrobaculum tricleocarpae TaxID=2591009 RepID=A0A545T7N4_9PROT|nr:methyltransferase domain-containing protein [Denitrobaculum tricleocarpae]TQV73236.1 methyltransferase domain-containing protein [Denitrobaculum tricleocarpae]